MATGKVKQYKGTVGHALKNRRTLAYITVNECVIYITSLGTLHAYLNDA